MILLPRFKVLGFECYPPPPPPAEYPEQDCVKYFKLY